MKDFENVLKSVTPKHNVDLVFILVGLGSLYLAIAQSMTILYVGVVFGLGLGGLIFHSTHKKAKLFGYIKENYRTNPDICLTGLKKEIEALEKAIAVDQRKADFGGKDAHDSADDVIRKTKQLDKYVLIKTEIEKYM